MKALSLFRRKVEPFVRGCPHPVMDDAILEAAIEFCDFTYHWRTEVESQRIRADQNEYDLDIPSCSRVVTVIYAGHDGTRLVPTSERRLDDEEENWRDADTTASLATYYYLPDRTKIRLAMTPDTSLARGLAIICALKPTVDATELPDSLYDDHLEHIGFGAKYRLMAMPGVAWSNAELAVYFKAEFEKAKKKEKAERLNDYTRESSLRVRPPNYYG